MSKFTLTIEFGPEVRGQEDVAKLLRQTADHVESVFIGDGNTLTAVIRSEEGFSFIVGDWTLEKPPLNKFGLPDV